MNITRPITLAIGVLLLYATVAAQPSIYDETANGSKQIADALTAAQKDNKKVLVLLGANWCGWCQQLHKILEDDKPIREALQASYILVHIDVNGEHNRDIDQSYGEPTRLGMPAIVVLDAEGKQLLTKDSADFEDGDHYNPGRILTFLQGKDVPKEKPEKPAQSQKKLDQNGMDTSALPEVITSTLVRSEAVEDLVHEVSLIKGDGIPLMERNIWRTPENQKTVRTTHRLLHNKKDVVSIIDFKETARHPETHSMIVSLLPEGVHLVVSEADSVSPHEWKLMSSKGAVLQSFVRDPDGLVRPRSRAEYVADMQKRMARLSRE